MISPGNAFLARSTAFLKALPLEYYSSALFWILSFSKNSPAFSYMLLWMSALATFSMTSGC